MARTILVPHDGHLMSDRALRYAIDIAKAMKMRIKIVRVIEEAIAISALPQLRDVERERVRKDLEQEIAKIQEGEYNKLQKQLATANSKGVEASALVVEGDIAQKILSVINKDDPYIVVIGSRRLQSRGLSRIKFLGSIARKLSEESKCPVLIVR